MVVVDLLDQEQHNFAVFFIYFNMKTIINYKYNLFPDKVSKVKQNYYFFINGIKYYVIRFERPIIDLELIANVNSKLESMNKAVYKIISTLKKENHFEFEGNNYVLFKVLKKENEIFDVYDLIDFNKLLKTKGKTLLNRDDWKKLWSEKVDYFEYRMSMVNENNELIDGSFSYYVGLAENAISYYNDTLLEEQVSNKELSISHKRIPYPVLSGKLYNPLNFIFDYKVRDIAEYFKTMFFEGNLDWEEVMDFFNKFYISKVNYRLFYARLLYPSYYFDAYEEYIDNKDEERLRKIVSKAKDYEDFLFDIYNLIKKQVPIPEVEWIMKNKKV